MSWNPKQIDLSIVTVSNSHIEAIAERVHDSWAAERIAAGWSYGKERDDILKTNQCLVPYIELPENEKQYDRATVITVLVALNEVLNWHVME